jgi:lysozyme
MASQKLSKACINLVRSFEGYHRKLANGDCTTYYCPAGVLTIGYGCTVGINPGDVWTHEQAIAALKRELEKHETAVNELVKTEINQNQFDALVSFSYNCGSGALGKSALLKKVNKGDFAGAAAEFHKWNKGGGKVLPGLVRRRAQEAELFLTPIGASEPTMPQAIDVPAPVTQTVRSSRTIFGILTAFGASLVGWFKDAVEQITLFEPAKQIGTGLGLNLPTIVAAITIAGLALALFARLDDAKKGATVK